MSGLKVLIVGASIAGPAAAYWFARAGADVTVIERFPELRTGGQNIDIRTVGVNVMRKMTGMEAAVQANLAPIEGMSMVRDDGSPIFEFKPTGNADRQSLISEFEIFRGDLSKIMYDMSCKYENVRYVFGEQITSTRQSEGDGPVIVEFANGRPQAEFDLIVAADGVASRTRAIALGCGVRDGIKSFNTWAAYATIKKDMLHGTKVGQAFNAVPGRMIGFEADNTPGQNKSIMTVIQPSGDEKCMAEFRTIMKQEDDALRTDALKALVMKAFKGIGWKSDEILEAVMDSDDLYASEWMQLEVPTLSKGRFALIGDAAHSAGPTGTGTSCALAAAYLLAGEVSKHKGDLSAGLKAYEGHMRPILKRMAVVPPFFPGAMAPQTAWGLQLRNLIIQFLLWGANNFGSLFSWLGTFFSAAFGDTKDDLPIYEWVHQ